MAEPYSNDLRKRVAKAIAAGETCRAKAGGVLNYPRSLLGASAEVLHRSNLMKP
jgi:hypothetical protein